VLGSPLSALQVHGIVADPQHDEGCRCADTHGRLVRRVERAPVIVIEGESDEAPRLKDSPSRVFKA
jgi:hypothetical protein